MKYVIHVDVVPNTIGGFTAYAMFRNIRMRRFGVTPQQAVRIVQADVLREIADDLEGGAIKLDELAFTVNKTTMTSPEFLKRHPQVER